MQESGVASQDKSTDASVDPASPQPPDPALPLLSSETASSAEAGLDATPVPGSASVATGNLQDLATGVSESENPGTHIRKKRRKKGKGKGRRSTKRRDPRRAAIRLWAAILGVAVLIFGGGAYLFQYVTEAGEKRDRAVREMAGYVKKIERLEATSQTAQMADAKIVDLHPEAQQSRLLPPQIGRAGSVVLLRLHTPDGPLENWDLTLRDEMRNVVTKAVVSPSDDGVILISATGLREGIYEISGKARSKRQVSRYSFALK